MIIKSPSRIRAHLSNLRATVFNPLRTFGFLLKEVSDQYVQRFEQRAGALGLTLPQCSLLVYLTSHAGVSQTRLAELTGIQPMTLVRILDRMESDGWLERRNHPTDRRARCLYPRVKSKSLLNDICYLADLTRREAFAGIPRMQADLVIALLEKIGSNFASLEPLQPGALAAALHDERDNAGVSRTRREQMAVQR